VENKNQVERRQLINSRNLEDALKLHQSGQLDLAAEIYIQLIENDHNNSHALHLLGVIALQMNDFQPAIDLINQAIKIEKIVQLIILIWH